MNSTIKRWMMGALNYQQDDWKPKAKNCDGFDFQCAAFASCPGSRAATGPSWARQPTVKH